MRQPCSTLTVLKAASYRARETWWLLPECFLCCKKAKSKKANVTCAADAARRTKCCSLRFLLGAYCCCTASEALDWNERWRDPQGLQPKQDIVCWAPLGQHGPSNDKEACSAWGSQQHLSHFLCATYSASDPGLWPVCWPCASFTDAEQG